MENWISATPTQGSEDSSVNVTVGENKTSMRTGTITISGGNNENGIYNTKRIESY